MTDLEKKDSIIHSMAYSLRESLQWSLVEEKEPPYRVPFAMQDDLWHNVEVDNKSDAVRIIEKAIENMTDGSFQFYTEPIKVSPKYRHLFGSSEVK